MARFDLYRMPGKGRDGFVVDVQADLLDQLATRVVVPLVPLGDAPPPIRDLNPVLEVEGRPHVLLTQALASVPLRELPRPVVGSVEDHRDDITRALDLLLTGF